jgi:predicted transposase YdaD
MPYFMTIEREAMKKGEEKGRNEGCEEGLRAGIRLGLKLRFGDAGLALLPAVEEIGDNDRLRSIREAIERIDRIEESRALLGR